MGFTHYFGYKPDSKEWALTWPQLVSDAQLIIEEAGVELAGGLGEGTPILTVSGGEFPDNEGGTMTFDGGAIWLNGHAPLDHETLLLHGPGPDADKAIKDMGRWYGDVDYVWAFCKTARKPYDVVVCTILMRAVALAPQAIVINSDGAWDDEWLNGAWGEVKSPRHLYRQLFGEDFPNNPLENESTDGPYVATKKRV